MWSKLYAYISHEASFLLIDFEGRTLGTPRDGLRGMGAEERFVRGPKGGVVAAHDALPCPHMVFRAVPPDEALMQDRAASNQDEGN